MQLDDRGNSVAVKLDVATNFVVPTTCAMEKLGTRMFLLTETPPQVNVAPVPVLALKVADVGRRKFTGVNSVDKTAVTEVPVG